MHRVRTFEYEKNKWQVLGEVDLGNSGETAFRILATNLSKKKADALVKKVESGEIWK